MSPEAPKPEGPATVPSEQQAPDVAVEVPALPEVPVLPEIPEVAADTTPPPVAEEAQIADRMVGPPPGMTAEDMKQNLERVNAEAAAQASAGGMVNALSPSTVNTPPQPLPPLPSFSTAEEAAARAVENITPPASTEPTAPEPEAPQQ